MRFTLEQIKAYGLEDYFNNNKEKFVKKNVVFSKPVSMPIPFSDTYDIGVEHYTKEYYYISEEYKDELRQAIMPSIKITVNPDDFNKAIQCMKQDIEDEKPIGIDYDEIDWFTGKKASTKIEPFEFSEAVRDHFGFFDDDSKKMTEQDVLELLLKMLNEK